MRVNRELAERESRLDMTPMIDVTFLLLIFFMCTLKFKTLDGKLSAYLPKDVGVNTTPAEPKEKIEIRMDLKAPGKGGDVVPLTLVFEDAANQRFTQEVKAPVTALGGGSAPSPGTGGGQWRSGDDCRGARSVSQHRCRLAADAWRADDEHSWRAAARAR